MEFCRALTSVAQVPSRRLSGPKGVRQSGLPLPRFGKIFAVQRQRTATHTVYSPQARQKVPSEVSETVPRGMTSAHCFLMICKRFIVGGHWPPTQHSAIAFIFHSPFSILHSAHAQFKQTAKKSGLPTALLYSEASACALFRAEFDFFALKDHICGAHGAHFTAHRAGMTLGRRNLIIEPLCLFRVECQRELRGPV